MSNGINNNDPNNRLSQTQFGHQGKQQQQPGEQEEAPAAQAPSAPGKSVEPGAVLKFLTQQGNLNLGGIENVPISNSISAFQTAISVERHQHLSTTFRTTYQEEFGTEPSDNQVQELVDDFIIGVPVIQTV